MEIPDLPAPLRAFLFDCIESYEQLELLLLLQRDMTRWWSETESAQALRLPENLAAQALADLAKSRLIEMREESSQRAYRYNPGSPELEYKTRLLVRHYGDRRLEIVRLMNANAIDRLRTAALRTFADSFLIKRTDDDR